MSTVTTTIYEPTTTQEPTSTTTQQSTTTSQEPTSTTTTTTVVENISLNMIWEHAKGMIFILLLLMVVLIVYEILFNGNTRESKKAKAMHVVAAIIMAGTVVLINVMYTQFSFLGEDLGERNYSSMIIGGIILSGLMWALMHFSGAYPNNNGLALNVILRVAITLIIAYMVNQNSTTEVKVVYVQS